MVAAVDLARVRKPALAEADEEEEAVEEMRQQEATTADKQIVEMKTAGPAAVVASEQRRVHFSQVGGYTSALTSRTFSLPLNDLCWLLQIQRTEMSSHVDSGAAPSPVPHFTVSKVSVPKHDSGHEVSRGAASLNPSHL